MEKEIAVIEPFLRLEKTNDYAKDAVELMRLKLVAKVAHLASSIISKLFFWVVVVVFIFMINIGLALWLGELLGKSCYGFLSVGGLYGVAALIMYKFLPQIKGSLNDTFVREILN